MRTKAALLYGPGQKWQVEDIDLGEPVAGEVMVRLAASGICHTEEHFVTGSSPAPFWPVLGGHEGAGVVTQVGDGVIGIEEGDHVVLAFLPACGICRPCARGLQNMCDQGAHIMTGTAIADDGYRVKAKGEPVFQFCVLGTFSPYVTVNQASVIKIEKDVSLEVAAVLGCGVPTGWGSATEVGGTRPGDVVVVVGVGGIGINAVQGAAAAGARFVVAIDPVAFKRDMALQFGATHAFASMEEAAAELPDLTWGRLADTTILTMSEMDGDLLAPALGLTGKAGQVILTAMSDVTQMEAKVSLFDLAVMQKRIQGAMFGGASPRTQVPLLLDQYRAGKLKLDELVTNTYSLEQINDGFEDMRTGRNLRGLIRYTEDDW